jgi:hypothetical protein
MAFMIRDITIENEVVLAPMAGVSNSAFRLLAREQGAGLVYAEMVSDKGLIYKNDKTIQLLYMTEAERPMAQQIFGSDLKTMVDAALYVDQHSNCDIIDINMGCPVPKVAPARSSRSVFHERSLIKSMTLYLPYREKSQPNQLLLRLEAAGMNTVSMLSKWPQVIERAGASCDHCPCPHPISGVHR